MLNFMCTEFYPTIQCMRMRNAYFHEKNVHSYHSHVTNKNITER